MELPTGIGFALVIALVVANGFFVATEFALVAVRRSRIEQLADEGHRTAIAAKDVVDHLDAYIAACQLGITMASLALGWIGEPVVAHLLEPGLRRLVGGYAALSAQTIAVALAFALITALHIVIGELAPKGVALQLPERTTLFVTHPIRLFYRAFRWPIVALNAVGNAVLRVFGLRPSSGHEMVHSAEELQLLVSASGDAGTVEPSEARIASRAFRFADLAASELMTPRTEVVAVPVRLPAAELVHRAEASPYSRLPVYEGTLDTVVGVLRVRDLLRVHARGPEILDLRGVVQPCPFVPHTKHADELLEEMQRTGEHLCVVVDEFGGTAGIITLTDLIEALVGPIHGRRQEPAIGSPAADGSRIFSGLVRLADLEEAAQLRVDDPERKDADTLGGIIMTKLGRLPRSGDEVTVGGRRFRVEEVRRRRVTAARLLPSAAAAVSPRAFDGRPADG